MDHYLKLKQFRGSSREFDLNSREIMINYPIFIKFVLHDRCYKKFGISFHKGPGEKAMSQISWFDGFGHSV